MNSRLKIAIETARIIKRKFDADRVFVLDNSEGEISHRKQTFVLATDREMREKFLGCDGFIVTSV